MEFWTNWNIFSHNTYYPLFTRLIKPHGILLWGHEATRIYKLYKKAVRTISMSKYNAHTEPIFKKLQFLKLNNIFKLQQLKFYYKLIKGDLPKHFQQFSYIHNFDIHHHYTRETSSIFIPRVNHAYAQKHMFGTTWYRQSIIHQTLSLIKYIHIVCAVSSILKSLFLVITKTTVMFQIVIYICTGICKPWNIW